MDSKAGSGKSTPVCLPPLALVKSLKRFSVQLASLYNFAYQESCSVHSATLMLIELCREDTISFL